MRNPTATNPDEYNGHTNRETWAMSLHLANDHGLYVDTCALVADAIHIDEGAVEYRSLFAAADAIAAFVNDMVDTALHPEPGETPYQLAMMMIADVGSFWRVDWISIAEEYVAIAVDDWATANA